jgi:hypothetical protein
VAKRPDRFETTQRARKIKQEALEHANKHAKPGTPEWVKVFEKRHRELVRAFWMNSRK